MTSAGSGTNAGTTKAGRYAMWNLLVQILRKPRESCLHYAPWRGHFGVHYRMAGGTGHRWWGDDPIKWWRVYTTIKRGKYVKAAFLYFRLTKDRPAVAIATYINKNQGVHHVTGNAQQ